MRALNALAKSPQFTYVQARATARKDKNVDWTSTKSLNADFNADVDGYESFAMSDKSVCEWMSASYVYVARG